MRAALPFAFVMLVGCGSPAPASVAPKAPAKPAVLPIPPCPESIVPGGDPLEAESFEGKPVVRVCVLGASEESRKAAQKVIELRPSETFSAERVRGDLQAILKLGIFDDASAHGLRVRDNTSVVLFYSVHDRPKISEIGFEGAKVLGDAELNAKLPFQKNAPYDPAKVNEVVQTVKDEYQARGYDSVRVALVAEPAGSLVRVRIKVDEGQRSRLSKVQFKGNKKLSEADLHKAAHLEVGDPYVQEQVDRATLLVTSLYYDRGFVQVRVDPEVTKPAGGSVVASFVIDEGDVYSMGTLHATKLGEPVEKELLEKVVRARPKQVFVRSALIEDIQRMTTFFEARGQRVEITPQTTIDPKKKTIDVTFVIEPR